MDFETVPAPELHGRRNECAVLDRQLRQARSGESSVLVLRGEAGIGKTALLDHVARHADGCRVVRAAGVESEMELPFAGLHQLCGPMLAHLERVPAPQRDALSVAFGLSAGGTPDRFLVALAVLSLLSEAAEERPLVCLVDDVQWLDEASAKALAFVARRMLAEPVALVFAVRDTGGADHLAGLPELAVGGIGEPAARRLLSKALPGPLDERVRAQLISETRGNPLALLELSRGLELTELAGGFGVPEPRPLASRIESSFVRRLDTLAPQTRRLLLVAAAEPVGDVTLLWRAAARLGLDAAAARPAQDAGLIELGARVRFFHPLVRSAVYGAAPLAERQAVHRALAAATDGEADPDRRAWHRAHAAEGPDERVAGELERSAERARARGGIVAAAAFLQRATELTPDERTRGARALAAAQAKFEAAGVDAAAVLLGVAEASPLDELQRARLGLLRAQIAFVRRRGSKDPPLLLEAAQRLVPLAPALARETHLEAIEATIYAGRLSTISVRAVAEAARTAPPGPRPPRPVDLLLDAFTTRFTDGLAAAAPALRDALVALRDAGPDDEDPRWLWLGCIGALDLWDDDLWHALSDRGVRLARQTGALSLLPVALTYRAALHVQSGDFATAAAAISEGDAISDATGNAPLRYPSLVLAAWRGGESEALELIDAAVPDATSRGEGRAIALAEHATAVLHNGLGQHRHALAAAQRACASEDVGIGGWSLVELVEAAARSDRPEVGEDGLARLTALTAPAGTDWALGIAARSRALLSEGDAAEALYREAVERLGRSRIVVQHARARLVYGEWLRREGRRQDARVELHAAYAVFAALGAAAFARRTEHELAATGAIARKRTAAALDALTEQEGRIALLAAEGRSNPEIGAQLFISPRTVEYHLHKVFAKLGVRSRAALPDVLGDPARSGPTT